MSFIGISHADDSQKRHFRLHRRQNHCGEKSFKVICPHCHNRIPKEMVKKKGYIISIIGARSSGKTNYITTLITELIRYGHCLGNIGTTPSNVANEPENKTEERFKNHFFKFLYENSKCPPQTDINDPNNRIPLIYELVQDGKTPIYLVFYDTAGENFADIRNIAANVKFLNHSDAVIFLLDTFAVPYVHNKLKGPLGLGDIELRYDKIISNLISHFEEGDSKVKNAHYKKPMALVFSKIDAILKNDELFQKYIYQYELNFKDYYTRLDTEPSMESVEYNINRKSQLEIISYLINLNNKEDNINE